MLSLSSFDEASSKFATRRRKKQMGTQRNGKKGGSLPGKRPNQNRNRVLYHNLLMPDYFGTYLTYDDCQFRCVCRKYVLSHACTIHLVVDSFLPLVLVFSFAKNSSIGFSVVVLLL